MARIYRVYHDGSGLSFGIKILRFLAFMLIVVAPLYVIYN